MAPKLPYEYDPENPIPPWDNRNPTERHPMPQGAKPYGPCDCGYWEACDSSVGTMYCLCCETIDNPFETGPIQNFRSYNCGKCRVAQNSGNELPKDRRCFGVDEFGDMDLACLPEKSEPYGDEDDHGWDEWDKYWEDTECDDPDCAPTGGRPVSPDMGGPPPWSLSGPMDREIRRILELEGGGGGGGGQVPSIQPIDPMPPQHGPLSGQARKQIKRILALEGKKRQTPSIRPIDPMPPQHGTPAPSGGGGLPPSPVGPEVMTPADDDGLPDSIWRKVKPHFSWIPELYENQQNLPLDRGMGPRPIDPIPPEHQEAPSGGGGMPVSPTDPGTAGTPGQRQSAFAPAFARTSPLAQMEDEWRK